MIGKFQKVWNLRNSEFNLHEAILIDLTHFVIKLKIQHAIQGRSKLKLGRNSGKNLLLNWKHNKDKNL